MPGIWNCNLLRVSLSEAALSLETKEPELPCWLVTRLGERGITLVYAELCDWIP